MFYGTRTQFRLRLGKVRMEFRHTPNYKVVFLYSPVQFMNVHLNASLLHDSSTVYTPFLVNKPSLKPISIS